eukprot:TRINITY_DN21389_c0_g1_i1.p1 TRINITY_DN21389_c0_g1~~TRINITY_DN21389_c0_g1_i1.p1  ORF type:complete len:467 (+),score=80.39 TRINITY_DN21389_c0_g1_i1:102-1502(+)
MSTCKSGRRSIPNRAPDLDTSPSAQRLVPHLASERFHRIVVQNRVKDVARAIAAESYRSEHIDWRVRLAAVKALARFVDQEEDCAVAAVTRRVGDAHTRVKQVAVEVLAGTRHAQYLEKGDKRAIASLTGKLNRESWQARVAAVQALEHIAEKGDEDAIAAMIGCFQDTDRDVRRAAVVALVQIVEIGDKHAIAEVGRCLEHPSSCVRRAAIEVLAQIVEVHDNRATIVMGGHGLDATETFSRTPMQALLSSLEDVDEEVRQAAVCALAKIIEEGDVHAIDAVSERLRSYAFWRCRCSALQLLALITPKGNRRAFAAVTDQMKHVDACVRQAALETLAKIAEKGDEQAIAAATALMEDVDARVRRSALDTLMKTLESSDERALAAIDRCQNDADWSIRQAAKLHAKMLNSGSLPPMPSAPSDLGNLASTSSLSDHVHASQAAISASTDQIDYDETMDTFMILFQTL